MPFKSRTTLLREEFSVFVLFVFTVSLLSFEAAAQEGVIKYISDNEPCTCVWYYMCNDAGRIITDGSSVIEQRSLIPTTPKSPPSCDEGITHICCRIPENATVATPTEAPLPKPPVKPIPIPRPEPDIEPEAIPVLIPKLGCGVKREPVTTRITDVQDDNTTASYAEFPWMLVVVSEQQPGVYKFECGASLIHTQVALTAAHCIQNLDQRALKVRAGEWNTRSTTEPMDHQDRSVQRVIIHPNYAPGPLYNDIALIILSEPFNIAENVDTICLPVQNAVFDGARCYATGWGKDSFDPSGSYQHILRKIDLPIIPRQQCEARLRNTRLGQFFRLHRSFVCAGGEPAKDTCKGDGGGPLVCPTEEIDRWTQVGIVSWGIDCGTTNPAVYVNVPLYTQWILEQVDAFKRSRRRVQRRHPEYLGLFG